MEETLALYFPDVYEYFYDEFLLLATKMKKKGFYSEGSMDWVWKALWMG